MTAVTLPMQTPISRPAPCIHAGDYAAWYKHATGEWIYDFASGQITNRRTGRLVPFRVTPAGYLEATVKIKGVQIHVLKHRAIWVAAHGLLALPIDYALEIDHINRNKCDCRLENLRLVRSEVNHSNTIPYLDADTVREIRRRYRTEPVSQAKLAGEYGICVDTVRNLINRKTYRGISDD